MTRSGRKAGLTRTDNAPEGIARAPCGEIPQGAVLFTTSPCTLASQNGVSHALTTSFEPVEPLPGALAAPLDKAKALRKPLLARLADGLVTRMHRM